MASINVPDRGNAEVVKVTLEASTTIDGEKKETEFSYDLPKSLGDAVAMDPDGERGVFRRVVNSLVIEAQGEERRKLAATGGGKERVRAKYLSELGL